MNTFEVTQGLIEQHESANVRIDRILREEPTVMIPDLKIIIRREKDSRFYNISHQGEFVKTVHHDTARSILKEAIDLGYQAIYIRWGEEV